MHMSAIPVGEMRRCTFCGGRLRAWYLLVLDCQYPREEKKPEGGSDGQERPGRRPRFLPESLATEHEYGSPASPGAASHRGPGTVPVQQPQQAAPQRLQEEKV